MITRRSLLVGLVAAPAIVRIESLMTIKAIENTRYITFLEAIYPGEYMIRHYNPGIWNGPDGQHIKVEPHLFNVNKLDDFMCAKMIMPV